MDISVNIIKKNEEETIRKLIKIEKQAFGDAGLDEWGLVPLIRHGKVMALQYRDEIVGGAQFFRDFKNPSTVYLVGIAIDKNFRGKGLGTMFLNECLSLMKSDGIRCVELTVDPANGPAVKVYKEKLGFQTIEERKDEYGEGEDRLVMKRAL